MPKKSNNRDPRKDAKLESNPAKNKVAKVSSAMFTSRVDIFVHHSRVTLADPDNLSIKYVLDAIVRRGILQDDSAKEIRHIIHDQTKVKNESEEETVLRIVEIEDE